MELEVLEKAKSLEKEIKEERKMIEKLKEHIIYKSQVKIGKGELEMEIDEYSSAKILERLKKECEDRIIELKNEFELL